MAKNGLVYPCKKKTIPDDQSKRPIINNPIQGFQNPIPSTSNIATTNVTNIEIIENPQPAPILDQQVMEPIFTIISANDAEQYVVGDPGIEGAVQEIHYVHEPFVENIHAGSSGVVVPPPPSGVEGIPTVIHYIQLDQSGHELITENTDTYPKIM